MFDGYILTQGSVTNIEADGKVTGYEMRTRIPYYRGVPLSMIHDLNVEVDGQPVPSEDIRFSADEGKHWFTLEEMWTVTTFRWEYADEAIIRVMNPGGLAAGGHELKLTVAVRVAYIPVPFEGTLSRTVDIAA